jgi:hypothetical protein
MRPGATAHRAGENDRPRAVGVVTCGHPPTGPSPRVIDHPELRPQLPHEAVRGNSPRMALKATNIAAGAR